MALSQSASKMLIRVDVSSDTVCPWCFVGKKNLAKAIDLAKDRFNFEVVWHPFFLDSSAPKEGIKKTDFYKQKFGAERLKQIFSRMTEIFSGLGYEYDTSGLTGNTLDSHRLITFAGKQGVDKQNAVVEELFLSYFTRGRYIGDWDVLLDAARKAGVVGAEQLREDPNLGLKEVNEELQKYSSQISGVPHFLINDKYELSGGQPPEMFLRAFDEVARK